MQVIVNAERYYRAMITRANILEYSGRHMVHTLENLMEFHGEAKRNYLGTQYSYWRCELRICVMMEQ
jgi:hypothetical protein